MTETALPELPSVDEMEAQFGLAFDAGQFRRALLWKWMLMRERALNVAKGALAMPEASTEAKAQASDAQRSAMLEAADMVIDVSDQLDVRQWAQGLTDQEARSVLLMLDLGTADAFRAAAEVGWIGTAELEQASRSVGGRASAAARSAKRDAVRETYNAMMKAKPALKPKEAAFELHQQFPERTVAGLEATIRRWRAAN